MQGVSIKVYERIAGGIFPEMLVVLSVNSSRNEMHAALGRLCLDLECPLKIYVKKSREGDKLQEIPVLKFSLYSSSLCICDCVG